MPRPRTLWEEGREPGRRIVTLAVALCLSAVLVDLALNDRVGVLFDVVFVLICAAAALLVRPADFFMVGVLPPLLMLAVFVILSLTHRESIADPTDGAVQAVVSGLSRHSIALGLGYALCLAVIAVRDRWTRGAARPLRRTGPGRPPRPGSPPATPRTSRRPWSAPQGSRPPR